MSENIKLFRTAMRGFNKEDVTEYIEKMNFNFKTDLDKMSGSLKKAEDELSQAQSKLDEFSSAYEENKSLKEELEKLRTELDALRTSEKELLDKISENEELIEAQNDALDQLCKENEALKSVPAPVCECKTDPEVEEKAKLYDKMSSKIGSVIIDANRNADSMISSAKSEGNIIIENAKKEAEAIISDAKKEAENMYCDAKKQADAYSKNYRYIFDKHSQSISDTIDQMENEMGKCVSDLKEKLVDKYN